MPTARDRARVLMTSDIKMEARRQLAEVGAQGLSLRAVARELGMVSSALYRYFPSRDHLLTELIIDAYNAIGAAAEDADQPQADLRGRWAAVWHAVREWALAHPHEYTLIYGSPIPGYQAPQDTIAPAARVALVLAGIVKEAEIEPPQVHVPLPGVLREQAERLMASLESEVEPITVTRLLIAWTQLFGMLNFELFGQYVGSVDPTDAFFAHTTEQMAEFIGLK
ncbi:TetR/AcrR family transcriptional regulator [Amycolatopsis sp. NPDC059657]|uniref:TetR/AcrR family transcriptional regulator n=1 Tax=Amycolatopsis sp. NPDC059657 TaxID=3346899 RepID=UPI00366F1E0C